MKRRHLLRFPMLFAFLVASPVFAFQVGGARSAPENGPVACRFTAAAGIPSWVTSGVGQDGRFLLVNVHKRDLVELSRTGVAEESRTALGDLFSGSITRIRQGASKVGDAPPILLELAGGRLFEVDRSLVPRRRIEMATVGLQSQGMHLEMLLDWIPMGNGQVFGYADLSAGDSLNRANWRNGFVRFDPSRPESFQVISESLYPGEERISILAYPPLMASIGSAAFVARIHENEMGLWRLNASGSGLLRMRAFPEHLRGSKASPKLAPLLPHFSTIEEYPRTMEVSESADMPAGLFAWEDSLFLLSRTFEHGQRRWYLSKIDPAADRVLWTVRVPGSSHHMMVIPGDQEWAFLEKGPVTAPLIQTTHNVRFVNSRQMRSLSLKSLCN